MKSRCALAIPAQTSAMVSIPNSHPSKFASLGEGGQQGLGVSITFVGDDDNTSDYLSEGLMHSLIASSRVAVKDPHDYEARSNIMWCATWALNTLVAMGKSTDWEVYAKTYSIEYLRTR